MNVLVTGATGNLGQALTPNLAAAGHSVRILSRRPQPEVLPQWELQAEVTHLSWAQGDLASGAGLHEAVEGVEAIIHLASDPRHSATVDVLGTQNLIRAAQRSRMSHFIYISIVGVDEIPYSYYQHKWEAEKRVQASALPYSILRATQFHSLVDTMISAAARVPLVMPLPTDFRFQSVTEQEVATRLHTCLTEGPRGRLPDFSGPEILTLGEMAVTWMRVNHHEKKLLHLPLPGALAKGFRQGKNTVSWGDKGVIGWEEWLSASSTEYSLETPGKAEIGQVFL